MQVEIKIDSSCIDPKVIILTASMTEDVSNIVKKLSENASQIISGYKDERIEILEQTDLIRIYANSGKVYAVTNKGEYILRLRFLYKGIIIKHNKTEPTYTKTSLFLCEKRRFFMARTEKGVVTTI